MSLVKRRFKLTLAVNFVVSRYFIHDYYKIIFSFIFYKSNNKVTDKDFVELLNFNFFASITFTWYTLCMYMIHLHSTYTKHLLWLYNKTTLISLRFLVFDCQNLLFNIHTHNLIQYDVTQLGITHMRFFFIFICVQKRIYEGSESEHTLL